MPTEHDVRQRAVICRDCWFWREMSCALPSPTSGICANRRPVKGRGAATRREAPQQATLQPLAAGHSAAPGFAAVSVVGTMPFSADDPEATFSVSEVTHAGHSAQPLIPPTAPVQPVVAARPPMFREIRAAAARIDSGEALTVAIPFGDGGRDPATMALPGMDARLERVRRRTAARQSGVGLTGR